MGQYKVPQDVEAEDKIIGFLTLKQFLYAVTGVIWGGLSFAMFKELPVFFVLFGIPPALLFLMLGLYRRDDQPFETLFLALVSFFVKPRKRIWQKEPLIEAFKIEEPPVKVEEVRRDPSEVRGQLETLAAIVDTRGWASKKPEVQEPVSASPGAVLNPGERLVEPVLQAAVIDAATSEVTLQDDILDFQNNPNAGTLNELIENAVKDVRQEAMDKMKQPAPASPKPPSQAPTSTLQPAGNPSISGMTANPIADILRLAMENDDLTVSQIAAQAGKKLALPEGRTVNVRNQS